MAQADDFQGHMDPLMGARIHAAVVKDDDADLPKRPIALYVLTSGDLALRMAGVDGSDVDITSPVTAGQVLPVQPRRVLATGTTATCAAWYWGDE